MNFSDFSIKHNIAVIQPFLYRDSETGNTISLTLSPRYSTITVDGIEYYFFRESGEFDGTGVPIVSRGPILAYTKENRGKSVSVVAFGGKILDRLVWEESEDFVYLCTQRCYDQLSAGDTSIRAVGFPREDVQGL